MVNDVEATLNQHLVHVDVEELGFHELVQPVDTLPAAWCVASSQATAIALFSPVNYRHCAALDNKEDGPTVCVVQHYAMCLIIGDCG